MKCHVLLMLSLSWAGIAFGQQDVGYVSNSNVIINGTLVASHGQTALGPSSALATFERPSRVVLARGGMMTVCQRSFVHLEVGHGARSTLKPIHLSLDLGAMEILTLNTSSDSIMAASGVYVVPAVPDREQTGVLHLAMRLGENGQTCIENRGNQTSLNIMGATGSDSYLLKPGQLVVFANGSVKDVSSSKLTSCGCPQISAEGSTNTNTAQVSGRDKTGNVDQNGSAFPFPAAESKNAPEPELLDAPRIRTASANDHGPAMVVAELNAFPVGPDQPNSVLPADVLESPAPNVAQRSAPLSLTGKGTKDRDSHKGMFASVGQFFARLFH